MTTHCIGSHVTDRPQVTGVFLSRVLRVWSGLVWSDNMLILEANRVMSLRSEVLSLYKQAIRLSKSWISLSESHTTNEREYIRSEARRLISENKHLTDEQQIRRLLEDGLNRLAVAQHYRIPYPRPVYYPTGAYPRRRKC